MTLTQRIAELVTELIRRNPSLGDVEAWDIEVTPWSIVFRLRPTPATLVDPCPAPRPPVNRMGRKS